MIDIHNTSEPLISLTQAREILSCGRSTIYAYVTRGFYGRVLETIWVGGRRKTTRKAIDEFLRSDSEGVASEPDYMDDPHGLHNDAEHESEEEAWAEA